MLLEDRQKSFRIGAPGGVEKNKQTRALVQPRVKGFFVGNNIAHIFSVLRLFVIIPFIAARAHNLFLLNHDPIPHKKRGG
jgi:hypothetical protein